ncbi:MAG: hypothetical protein BGN97_03675 [Microbacterium sp. 69-10]|uniref:hypothetical protein n=1 Tax=Microbacterium sp. 69-10 TaxID=1895783 RepID=UPI00096677ED|nr:hypothetical protein [Microbacterium sp. 69-10]OJU41812.1 MAG: hypothetical protein BGN97_03675 [Microbacterium sp. 69-10]
MAVSRTNPHHLGTRGLRLWKSIETGKNLSEIEQQNLVEACRIADRLEKLDELVRGDEDAWFRLKLPRTDDGVIEVLINDPMKEARMHAAALRQLIAPFEAVKSDEGTKEVPSNVASIKEAAARKGRAAAGSKRSAK